MFLSDVKVDQIESVESATVETINTNGAAPIVLVCEHASNFIPEYLDGLGISEDAASSHAAWDPGALAVAELLSAQLNAPLVVQRVSRLVYDCNRPPEAQSAMPVKSEIYEVPGNVALSEEQRQERVCKYYIPFQRELKKALLLKQSQNQLPVVITIHSFTPIYNGEKRSVELGILHDNDTRFADELLAVLCLSDRYNIQRNEPYGPNHGVTHTLVTQAQSRGLLNVMIEVRNDLIADAEGQKELANLLGTAIMQALPKFTRETVVFGQEQQKEQGQ